MDSGGCLPAASWKRRKTGQPRIHYRRPQDRRSRPQRWRDAVRPSLTYKHKPSITTGSTTCLIVAERLEAICEYDFGDLEALEPPRSFERD